MFCEAAVQKGDANERKYIDYKKSGPHKKRTHSFHLKKVLKTTEQQKKILKNSKIKESEKKLTKTKTKKKEISAFCV